jgi:hypothetical protein
MPSSKAAQYMNLPPAQEMFSDFRKQCISFDDRGQPQCSGFDNKYTVKSIV